MENKIKFEIGDENRYVITTIKNENDYNQSIFKSQFKAALLSINSHLQNIGNAITANNIFSFIGDRGSGKTSCMRSISKMITGDDKVTALDIISNKSGINIDKLKEHTFIEMEMIDPTYFDERHNILEFFIAKLYKEYRKRCENPSCQEKRLTNIEQQELAKCFSEAQRHLKYMYSKNEDCVTSVEQLQHLAASSDLNNDFKKLIETYCKNMHGNEHAIIIVPIDDIDLNTNQAAKMAEEIRKYLVQDNIIVLMALKFSQLDRAKQLEYIKEYEPLLGKKKKTLIANVSYEEKTAHDVIKEMSIRYLIKLLPEEQKIHMPEISEMKNMPIELYQNHTLVKESESIAQLIVDEIFRKTQYAIFNKKYKEKITKYNEIIPNNLRDTRQLIKLLHDMKDPSSQNDSQAKAQTIRDNQIQFQQYLFETWALVNTDASVREELEKLRDVKLGTELNAITIRLLQEHFSVLLGSSEEEEIKIITNIQNYTYNYSFGDIITLIDYIENRSISRNELKFIYLLKFIYTIKLHEFVGTDEYSTLVGGCYFNSRIFKFIPTPNKQPDYNIRRIDLSKIQELASTRLFEEGNDYATVIKEFFMLCTSRGIDRKFNATESDTIDFQYRKKKKNWQFDDFHDSQKNVVFDINSFLYNWANFSNCEERFGISSKEDKNQEGTESVYGPFEHIKEATTKLTDYEVIADLREYLEAARFDGTNASGYSRFSHFLNLLSKFKYGNGIEPFKDLNDYSEKLKHSIKNQSLCFEKVFNSAPYTKPSVLKPLTVRQFIRNNKEDIPVEDLYANLSLLNPEVMETNAFIYWISKHKNESTIKREDIEDFVELYNGSIKKQ